jgi:hypothetical protein
MPVWQPSEQAAAVLHPSILNRKEAQVINCWPGGDGIYKLPIQSLSGKYLFHAEDIPLLLVFLFPSGF